METTNLNEVVLFTEDFSSLELGATSTFPLTAEGEYHVVNRRMGRWTEATIHGSWRAGRSANWKVLHENGEHVMAHTQVAPIGPPMLIAGDPYLSDYVFAAKIKPQSFAKGCGLIVRYRTCRSYVAVQLTRGHLALVHRHHNAETLLASRGYLFDVDRYYQIEVKCVGAQIRVSVDGEQILAGEETEYRQGKVGFWASAPARFAQLALSTSHTAQAEAEQRAVQFAKAEAEAGKDLPRPVLWKQISTAGFGTDRNLRFGDLDGDGKPEIVVAQRIELGNGNYPEINCLTALNLEGEILWQIGEPSSNFQPATADVCVQVHDLNHDGRAEVIFCKDLRIWMADGATGEIIHSAPTPRTRPSDVTGGRPYDRITGDSIYFCNLSGGAHAQELLIKDRYANLWALDRDFNCLWHHEAVTGHFPAAFDLDGDGCDEVMAGYSLLDHDGSLLWELPYGDHQDAIGIGHFDADNPEELLIALSIGDEGFLLVTATGEVLAQHKLGHVQNLAIANLRPERNGLEYATINYWGHPGIMAVFDSRGELLDTYEPIHYASALTPVNWDYSGQEYLFLSSHPEEGGLIDGHCRRVMRLPDDGHPYYCYSALDLTGDGRDELVTWDTESIWIYRADAPVPAGRRYQPLRSPLYNESNYMARVSIPNWTGTGK